MDEINSSQTFLDHIFYKNILESLEDYGVLTTDMHGVVTSWNKGAENIFGFTEIEVSGKSAKIIFTETDCKNGVPEHEFTEAMEKGRGLDERYHQKKDGSLFWASGLIFPLNDHTNTQIGFTKILRNLSHFKQAEEELQETRQYAQSIVETSKEPMIILGADLNITKASNAFFKLFSIERSQVENHNFFEVLKKNLDPSLLQSEMQKKDSFENFEISYPGNDSFDPRILLVSSRKVFATYKSIGQHLLTFEDVTLERRLEQAKDEFISIASHELKTPITSLTLSLQLLEKLTAEKEDFKSLNFLASKASAKVSKLTQLVKDLLDVTKIQSGRLDLVKTDFKITELVYECAEELQNAANDNQIEILGDETLYVHADRNRISQVLINFLSNAIKYSPGSKIIKAEISHSNDAVKISITDFGLGIEEDKIPFVFERFFRVEATSQNYAGLGLGLYISSEIIRYHNGFVGIESKVGEGSTFWFTIPDDFERNRLPNSIA